MYIEKRRTERLENQKFCSCEEEILSKELFCQKTIGELLPRGAFFVSIASRSHKDGTSTEKLKAAPSINKCHLVPWHFAISRSMLGCVLAVAGARDRISKP